MDMPAYTLELRKALEECQSAIAYWTYAGIHTPGGPVDTRLQDANNQARALLADIEKGT